MKSPVVIGFDQKNRAGRKVGEINSGCSNPRWQRNVAPGRFTGSFSLEETGKQDFAMPEKRQDVREWEINEIVRIS